MIKKKRAAAFCILTAVTAVLCCVISAQKKSLSSQMMAQRWSDGETEYSQISVFYPHSSQNSVSSLDVIHASVSEKLKEEGLLSVQDGVNVWLDAYSSSFSKVSVTLPESSTGVTCMVSGVSGSFFQFHPLELLDGNYIYSEELRNDRVVIDEESAWQLFSSFDVTGMKLCINERVYEIAGVVRPEQGKTEKMAYPSVPLIYMHYSALEEADLDTSVLCYETVLPDPVENYARNIILESMGVNTMVASEEELQKNIDLLDCLVIDNTSRFSTSVLLKDLKNFGESEIVSKPVLYPYWENASRVMSLRLSVLTAAALISGFAAVIILLAFLFRCYINRTWHLKDFIEKLTYKYTYKKKISDYIDISENK